MVEKTLDFLFKKFLISKGYPEQSLFSEIALGYSGKIQHRIDMAILDTTNKEYIAVIEFKSQIDERIKNDVVGQFYQYFGLLGTQSIPAYLVTSTSDEDFQIYYLTDDNNFRAISKEDFPLYETLSVKRVADEKAKLREGQEKKMTELERRKRATKVSAYGAILSLTIGVAASIISIVAQQKGLSKSEVSSIYRFDSLQIQSMNLRRHLDSIESKLFKIDGRNSPIKTDTLYISSSQLEGFKRRLAAIEGGISSSPEKTLSIIEIRSEIELLKKADEDGKELTQSKIDALKSEVDVQNAWMLGVLIAIFGTILAMVIPNILPRRMTRD